jgi:single stranded DNA-binding protein
MSKAEIRVEGFVTKDPELRQHNGKSVIAVDIAHTPRKKDGDQWVDAGETIWFQASFWEKDAEAIASSVRKSTLVTVTGQPELNVYQRQDGTPGVSVRIKFGTLGIIPREAQSASYAPNNTPAGNQTQNVGNGAQMGAQSVWNAPAGGYNDETPF